MLVRYPCRFNGVGGSEPDGARRVEVDRPVLRVDACPVEGVGCKVWGLGLRACGVRSRVKGVGCRMQGVRLRV